MELKTRLLKAKAAAKAWDDQYWNPNEKQKSVSEKLHAEKNLTVERVNEIIGNDSWTTLHCSECNTYVDAVVEVGQPADYESETAWLCRSCVRKAWRLIENALAAT